MENQLLFGSTAKGALVGSLQQLRSDAVNKQLHSRDRVCSKTHEEAAESRISHLLSYTPSKISRRDGSYDFRGTPLYTPSIQLG